jgi:hypothetical protein
MTIWNSLFQLGLRPISYSRSLCKGELVSSSFCLEVVEVLESRYTTSFRRHQEKPLEVEDDYNLELKMLTHHIEIFGNGLHRSQ